jgi:hypothetical protein
MRHRLRPVRTQRRVRFRVTWPTIVLPIVALVVLARGDALRVPLGEREAGLAIAAQPRRGHLSELSPSERTGTRTPASIAAASVAPRLLSSGEFHLRLPGVVAGATAVGVAVVLGERLFATRIGVAAALLLLALPASRGVLGTQLGAESVYLLAMLTALAAIRDMAEARRSAVVAGVASGIAVAFGGRDGIWLPAFAITWLWLNQGLTWRSFGAVAASALGGAAVATAAAQLALGRWASPASVLPAQLASPQLARSLASPAELAWSLAPLVPVSLLGLAALPSGWSANPSLRFLVVWLVFALASLWASGSPLPAYVACLYLAAMLGVWGLERSRRAVSLAAVGVSIAIAVATVRAPAAARGDRALDRWAVREAGRFLWRTVPAERRIAAAPGARQRLAYYGRRPISSLVEDAPLAGADYVVLPRDDFRDATRDRRRRHGAAPETSLRMLAEFGPWVIARVVSDEPASAAAKASAPAPGFAFSSPAPEEKNMSYSNGLPEGTQVSN